MADTVAERPVRSFGKVRDVLDIPELVAVQRKSYEYFLQVDSAPTKRKRVGFEALFQEIFPIESYDKSMHLEYLYYELEKPRYELSECRQLGLTYGYPLKIRCRLRTKAGEDLTEQSVRSRKSDSQPASPQSGSGFSHSQQGR